MAYPGVLARAPMKIWMLQGLLLAALCGAAWIRIPLPFTPVPLTLQVLIVLLAGMALGGGRALGVVGAFLLLGAAGAPVFSGGAGGAFLAMATGGYLLGFLPMAWLAGTLISRDRIHPARDAAALAASLAVLYLCGAAWLMGVTGISWKAALTLGVAPFVAVDAVKAVTAYSLFRVIQNRVRRAA